MSMVTSCPSCATTFRVTTEQLKARQGKVRCGQCLAVFDGFKSLSSVPDEPMPEAPPPPPPPPDLSNNLSLLDFEPPPHAAASRAQSPAFGAGSDVVVPPAAMPDVVEPTTVEILPTPQPRSDPVQSAVVAPKLASSASTTGLRDLDDPPPARRRRRGLWFGLAGLLLLALLLQAVYLFRIEIAMSVPAAKPLLDRMCALAGCAIQPPKDTDALKIEGSDLQTERDKPNVIVLTASLRNIGRIPVAYPSIELTLTNAQDQTVARRVIPPRDYLGERVAAAAANGMPPQTEVPVRLELDTGDLRPAGYRLYLFYP
jgi:predicted Zn finger-like uncharacterized protein